MLGEIFRDGAYRPIFLDQVVDDVVEWLEHPAVHRNLPSPMRHDVVAGACLRLGARSEQVLIALRRDVIDVDFDLVLLAPLLAKLGESVIRTRYPMVPNAERQLAGLEFITIQAINFDAIKCIKVTLTHSGKR